MIGHSETAANRIASVVMGFKEALLEEAEKQKDKKKLKVSFGSNNFTLTHSKLQLESDLLANYRQLMCLLLLCVSAYAVIRVVRRSSEKNDSGGAAMRSQSSCR